MNEEARQAEVDEIVRCAEALCDTLDNVYAVAKACGCGYKTIAFCVELRALQAALRKRGGDGT